MLNCTCDKGEIITVKDNEEDINAFPQVASTIFVLSVTSLMQGEGVGKESCRKLHNMRTDPVDKRLDDTVTYGVILFFQYICCFFSKLFLVLIEEDWRLLWHTLPIFHAHLAKKFNTTCFI